MSEVEIPQNLIDGIKAAAYASGTAELLIIQGPNSSQKERMAKMYDLSEDELNLYLNAYTQVLLGEVEE